MTEKRDKHAVEKVPKLLDDHKNTLIEELGPRAFELLSPRQVMEELGISKGARIPDLIRQGWLEPAQGQDIGPAHLYYRWRVEFVKRFKRSYKRSA